MREVIIPSKKLVKILEERAIRHEEIKAINAKQLELEDEKVKIAYKMDKMKDKTADIIKANPIEVSEFEYIMQVELKDGQAVAIIADQVEQYKEMIREEKVKKLQE